MIILLDLYVYSRLLVFRETGNVRPSQVGLIKLPCASIFAGLKVASKCLVEHMWECTEIKRGCRLDPPQYVLKTFFVTQGHFDQTASIRYMLYTRD